jgi:hypothetical protein
LVAAVAGVFGRGVASSAVALDTSGTLVVEYERFLRAGAPSTLRVRRSPSMSSAPASVVRLDRGYVDGMRSVSAGPGTPTVVAGSDRVEYSFAAHERDRAEAFTFVVEPRRAGRLSARIGVDDGTAVTFDQFVYP